eukprot:6224522-Prymnesium_polylepis.2
MSISAVALLEEGPPTAGLATMKMVGPVIPSSAPHSLSVLWSSSSNLRRTQQAKPTSNRRPRGAGVCAATQAT